MNTPGKWSRIRLLGQALLLVIPLLAGCGRSGLEPWHTVELKQEFTADRADEITTLDDYLALEERLFEELDREIYARSPKGPENTLLRYHPGSISDPRGRQPDWNHSFLLEQKNPIGSVLLLHGMSDSPYSLRALGQTLHARGYQVLGLRMPGHGTAPSGMLHVHWRDMAAATRLGVHHLRTAAGGRPLHIIGYSTGAALALDYALEAGAQAPDSLVLISPAIGLSPVAALASWKRRLSLFPGLGGLAWTVIEQEFDPYKYNSFTTNAGEQVFRLTRSVSERLRARSAQADGEPILPPTLVLKSAVDATVSTDAVVDRLLNRLAPRRHELVLFDVNRFAPASALLVEDPAPLTRRLLEDASLPFTVTLVGNDSPQSRSVSVHHKPPFSAGVVNSEALGIEWPPGVFSLSHVALPFPPEDPLYGRYPPKERGTLFLGQQALQGERGVLRISPNFLLRLRHNPFYDYLERRIEEWLADSAP